RRGPSQRRRLRRQRYCRLMLAPLTRPRAAARRPRDAGSRARAAARRPRGLAVGLAVIAFALALASCDGASHPSSPAPTTDAGASSDAAGGATGALTRVTVTVPAGLDSGPYDVPRTLMVPAGWSASVYARVPKARFMSVTPSGDLLVSQPSEGKVLMVRKSDWPARPLLTLRPAPAGTPSEFLGGLNRPHDMVFAQLSGKTWLFVAQADRVVRYPYSDGDLRAQPGQAVVDGLPDTSTPELRGQYAHVLKNIAVHDGKLY